MTMREILFRGKSLFDGGFVEGFLFKTKEHTYIAFPEQYDDDLFLATKNIFIEVDLATVGQYTGLTDKNSKKIFEGDICRFYGDEEYSDYEVFFTNNAPNYQAVGFYVKQLDTGAINTFDAFFASNCEVIGNIYDNPELIDKQRKEDGKNG